MITFHHADYADAFEQETGLVGWEQRYAQLGPGAYRGRIEALAMPGITIYRERIGLPILQEVMAPKDQVVFGVSLGVNGSWRFNAGQMATGEMTIAPGGRDLVASGSAPSDLLIVCVDRNLLESELGRPIGDEPVPVRPGRHVSDISDWMLSLLASSEPQRLAYGNGTVLAGLVLDRLAGLADESVSTRPVPAQPAFTIYRRIRDYVDDQSGEPLSVRDIADGVGIAPNLVRSAFAQAVGLTPAEWIRKRRLNAVRRELVNAAEAERTVSEIAMSWGFWHLGRFAQYYAAQFGEAPSETIYRSRLA